MAQVMSCSIVAPSLSHRLVPLASRSVRSRNPSAVQSGRSPRLAVIASADKEASIFSLPSREEDCNAISQTIAGSLFATLASAPSAAAAQEVLSLAEGDNRAFALLVVLVPALGWVLFNILRPALNQLDKMQKARSVAVVGGLGAAAAAGMLLAPSADAAQLVADVAEDNRPFVLLIVLAAALGWVLFNILRPALNQLNNMTSKKGVIGGIGLSAALALYAGSADAAQEFATLAEDNRASILLLVLLPAIGWVLFNILRPALNQLKNMGVTLPSLPAKKGTTKITAKGKK